MRVRLVYLAGAVGAFVGRFWLSGPAWAEALSAVGLGLAVGGLAGIVTEDWLRRRLQEQMLRDLVNAEEARERGVRSL